MAPGLQLQLALLSIGLALIWPASYSVLGSNANLQYKAAEDVASRMFDVQFLKDADKRTLDKPIPDVEYSYGKKSQRFIRAIANRTSLTTSLPYNSTDSSTTAIPVSMTKLSTMTPMSLPQNTTETSFHKYYTSKFIENAAYFTDLKALYSLGRKNITQKSLTSGRANAINFIEQKLKFKFPFYGHNVESAIVTAAGFLHIGPVIHRFMDDVHYIAPLMGDFFSDVGRPVIVYIQSRESDFTIQWESVYEPGANQSKPFTFQATLYVNGTIIFAYKNIPYNIANFVRKDFPPKVGLADGFIITEYYNILVLGKVIKVPINTIYRYHTVSLKKENIKSNSAYVLSPIPNCVQAKTCDACFSDVVAQNFECKWCSKLNLCSDAFDWHRQNWIKDGCDKMAYNSKDKCSSILSDTSTSTKGSKATVGIIVGVLIGIIVICIVVVLIYGYKNPTSKLGLAMIRYRPSKLFTRFK